MRLSSEYIRQQPPVEGSIRGGIGHKLLEKVTIKIDS